MWRDSPAAAIISDDGNGFLIKLDQGPQLAPLLGIKANLEERQQWKADRVLELLASHPVAAVVYAPEPVYSDAA